MATRGVPFATSCSPEVKTLVGAGALPGERAKRTSGGAGEGAAPRAGGSRWVCDRHWGPLQWPLIFRRLHPSFPFLYGFLHVVPKVIPDPGSCAEVGNYDDSPHSPRTATSASYHTELCAPSLEGCPCVRGRLNSSLRQLYLKAEAQHAQGLQRGFFLRHSGMRVRPAGSVLRKALWFSAGISKAAKLSG